MKRNIITILTICFGLTISCTSKDENSGDTFSSADSSITKNNFDSAFIKQLIKDYDLNISDTFSISDINGDGQNDNAIIRPLTFVFQNNKMDTQYVNIDFTCNLPTIKHYNGFRGLVANAGDLDGNGIDEIIYYPDWYQSNSAGIYIYGYRHHKWTLFGSGSVRRDIIDDQENGIKYLKKLVKKVDNESFKLTQHMWTEEGKFVDSTTTIIIK